MPRRGYVSIHAPYAGSDGYTLNTISGMLGFQSTPPMQGATYRGTTLGHMAIDVSIHAPYAGSDLEVADLIFEK